MKVEQMFVVYDENNIRTVAFAPTGDILLKFVLLPQLSVLDHIKVTEELLKVYSAYVNKILK